MSIKIKHHRSPAAENSAVAVVSIELGHVTGKIVRSIYDGGTTAHDAHITIAGGNTPSRIDDPRVLRDLAEVAAALASELAVAQDL